jgi:hypothetical protein
MRSRKHTLQSHSDPFDWFLYDTATAQIAADLEISPPINIFIGPFLYPLALNHRQIPAYDQNGQPILDGSGHQTTVESPQVVGIDGVFAEPIMWEENPKTHHYDRQYLNRLIPPDSGWNLWDAYDINDNGVIAADGWYQPHDASGNPVGPRQWRSCLLAPVEFVEDSNDNKIVDGGDASVMRARIGLWDQAYDSAVNVRNGNSEVDNFIGSDNRRFYIRIANPAANIDSAIAETIQVDWYSTKSDGTDDDHPPGKLALFETGSNTGVFVSKAVVLVSDDVDANQQTNDGSGAIVPRGSSNHRLRRGTIDGFANVAYSFSTTDSPCVVKVPVFDSAYRKRLKVNVIDYVGSNGPYASSAYIAGQVDHAQLRWAQAGLKIDISSTIQRTIPAAALDANGDYSGSANSSEETLILNDLIPLVNDNSVTVVFLPLAGGSNAYTTVAQRTSVNLGNRFFIFIASNLALENETLAHELFHCLYNRFDDSTATQQYFTFNTVPPVAFGIPLPDVRVYRRIHSSTIFPNDWLRTRRTLRFPIDSGISVTGPSTGNTLLTNY